MKKALITGISGFAGSFLSEHLLEKGYIVAGTYLTPESLKNLPNKEKIKLHQLNLLDENKTLDLIKSEKPDYLFHLAALISPRASFDNPKETFVNNIGAEINILEAFRKCGLSGRILIVSSGEVYGLVSAEDLPIDEETPFNPTNPYAVSKLAQDFLGLQYFLSHKLKIVRVRPFNHAGPRQSSAFVISAFAKGIAEIEKGKRKVLSVGNIKSKRDFSDVRDMVKAYALAIDKGEEGQVYNLGGGKSFAISQILEMLISLSVTKIEIQEDKTLFAPSDNPQLVCDYSKFAKLTGWKPEIPIEKTLKDTLDYWRNEV
ncbi:MAG: GDP-mannose 4,6-dehydratase [Candidatus Levybacteria bacterium]|nr:GDP-mannose 4,6-dehydratase [Candidatus Levybacteria bacterium]